MNPAPSFYSDVFFCNIYFRESKLVQRRKKLVMADVLNKGEGAG